MNARSGFLSFLICLFLIIAFFCMKFSNAVQVKKDSEIISILVALDKNEIAAANEVIKKSPSPAVKHYAQHLKMDHSKNLDAALNLSKETGIVLIDTPITNSLKQQGKKELAQLSQLKNKQLEQKYIALMIQDHDKALNMMDHNLLRNVSDSELKNLLKQTRPHLKDHLKQAQVIQQNLR